jgi:phage-related protein
VTSVTKKISGSVAGMSKSMASVGRAASRMGGLLRVAAVGLVAGAAGKALSSFGDRADDISDVAKRVGMSAVALQEFQYAAKMADLSAEDLTSVLQKMNNNLGSGALYGTLVKVNPQLARQLKHTKDSEQAFTTLMDAISKETNVQKRAAIAQAAFGKSGQAVIDMAADLNEKRKEAQASGAIISDDDVAAGAALHNSILRIKAAGMGILNTVLGRLAQSIGPVLEGFNKWILANKEFIGQKIDMVFKVIGDIFRQVGPSILKIIEKLLPAIQMLIDRALPVFVDLLEMVVEMLGPVLDLLGPVLDIFEALTPAIKAVAGLIKAVLVPVLMMLKPVLELIAIIIKPIVDAITFVSNKATGILGPLLSRWAGSMNGAAVSPNAGMAAGMGTIQHYQSSVAVNFGNAPRGTSIRSSGAHPGVTLNLGPAAGGAH